MIRKSTMDHYTTGEVPFATNKVVAEINYDAFFDKYEIISYHDPRGAYRNIPYADMVKVPHLSVYGLWHFFYQKDRKSQIFFILSYKKDAKRVFEHLRNIYPSLLVRIENFVEYPSVRDLVITSLALNSLARVGDAQGCYSDGKLMLSDIHNFGYSFIPGSWEVLVCLQIAINSYWNMTAVTKTISKVYEGAIASGKLKKRGNKLFMLKRSPNGMPDVLTPCTEAAAASFGLKPTDLFWVCKAGRHRHAVPLLPFSPEKAKSGRLFYMYYTIEALNKAFEGMICVKFTTYAHYIVGKNFGTKNTLDKVLEEVLTSKRIRLDNPFSDNKSSGFSERLINVLKTLVPADTIIEEGLKSPDAAIHIVLNESAVPDELDESNPESNKSKKGIEKSQAVETYYYKGAKLSVLPYPVQHTYYIPNAFQDLSRGVIAKARRILLELCAKLIVKNGQIPVSVLDKNKGWEYIQYKQIKGMVHGVSMIIDEQGALKFQEYGLSIKDDTTFEFFIKGILGYPHPEKLKGSKDYKVVRNLDSGNTYVIIDTDEMGIPNALNLDVAYEQISKGRYILLGNLLNLCREGGATLEEVGELDDYVREQDWYDDEIVPYDQLDNIGTLFPFVDIKMVKRTIPTISMFKNKDKIDEYLGAFYGVHVWTERDLEGGCNGMAYIVGKEPQNIVTKQSNTLHTAPHARFVFPLLCPSKNTMKEDKERIISMLDHPMGVYGESATYPLGFKLTGEYLERRCLELWELHWREVNTKAEL